MSYPCPCDRKKCIEQWKDIHTGEEDSYREEDSYEDGGYDLMHCEQENCHSIYWKGKNGTTCEHCSKELCELCESDEKIGNLNSDDEWFCVECIEDYNKKINDLRILLKRARQQGIMDKKLLTPSSEPESPNDSKSQLWCFFLSDIIISIHC